MTFIVGTRTYRHGTSAAYVEGKCRCFECREVNRIKAAKRRREQAYGRYVPTFVDAKPVRAHVKVLQAQGLGLRQISKLTGASLTSLGNLVSGRSEADRFHGGSARPIVVSKISRKSAEAIMALKFTLDDCSKGTLISSRGFVRRAQALACLGYSFAWQGKQIGVIPSNFPAMLLRDLVTVSTHTKMTALYEQYSMTRAVAADRFHQAGITRTLYTAKRLKWVAPFGWDDIDEDESPVAFERDAWLVDEVKIDLIRTGVRVNLTRAERTSIVPRLREQGVPAERIGQMIGVSTTAIERQLGRMKAAA